MKAWGFDYNTNIVWLKVRKDGGPDGRGVGFYYRNVTELVLFGTRGHLRTGQAGRRMVNVIATMKQRHSQKPDELYDMIEHCSRAPFLELFARSNRRGWTQWGDEIPPGQANIAKEKVTPRPMEDGMIRIGCRSCPFHCTKDCGEPPPLKVRARSLIFRLAVPVPRAPSEIHLATLLHFWHNYSCTHPAQNFKHNLR